MYGELGRTTLRTKRYVSIIKYWFKILTSSENKYIYITYKIMLNDLEQRPNTTNWASLVKDLLSSLGFNEVWLQQGAGNYNVFMSVLKQRLTDTFIQNWHIRLNESTRAVFYRSKCNRISKKLMYENLVKLLVGCECHRIDWK